MKLIPTLAAGALVLGLADAAVAGNPATTHQPQVKTGNKLNHHNQQVKIYPKFESLYIKNYPQPHINCGACYGYYKTQWKSWGEACGEPTEVIITSTTPIDPNAKEVTPKPTDVKPGDVKPADVKPGDVKPVDPKPADVKPVVPDVKPLPVPLPDPKPAPIPDPKPIEPKKAGEGKSTALPVLPPLMVVPIPVVSAPVVQATPVSISTPVVPHSEAPSIPLIPTLPVVNVK